MFVSYPWIGSVLAVYTAALLILWFMALRYGRRERELGYDDGYESGQQAAAGLLDDSPTGWLAPLPAEPPVHTATYAGTVTTVGLPDDTFPGWPSSGRHARGPGLVDTMTGEGTRMLTTGDLAIVPQLVMADDFLRNLDAWERKARAECTGLLA
jgi:hypothetical protein